MRTVRVSTLELPIMTICRTSKFQLGKLKTESWWNHNSGQRHKHTVKGGELYTKTMQGRPKSKHPLWMNLSKCPSAYRSNKLEALLSWIDPLLRQLIPCTTAVHKLHSLISSWKKGRVVSRWGKIWWITLSLLLPRSNQWIPPRPGLPF